MFPDRLPMNARRRLRRPSRGSRSIVESGSDAVEGAAEDLAASGGGDARDPMTFKLERPRNPPPASVSLERENCGVAVAEIARV